MVPQAVLVALSFSLCSSSFLTARADQVQNRDGGKAEHRVVVPRPQSKEAARLNGPVKTVLEEFAAVTLQADTWIEELRKPYQLTLYDEDGNLDQQTRFMPHGDTAWTRAFDYDESGKQAGATLYDGQGVPFAKEVARYELQEQSGYTIELVRYDLFSDVLDPQSRLVATFNADGAEIQRIRYQNISTKEPFETRTSVIYNSLEHAVVEEDVEMWQDRPSTAGRRLITYDPKGNELKRTEISGNQPSVGTTTYRYETFDAHGNWTERVKKETRGSDAQAQFTVEYRTIAYYE